jgi:hypothetical protein
MSPLEIVGKLIGLVLDLLGNDLPKAQDLLTAEAVRRANLAADAIEAERFDANGLPR